MEKQKGQTIPVYVKGNMHAYDLLKEYSKQTGTSISEYIRRGMECAALEQACSLQLTPAAYFAIQDGCFDVLTRVYLSNGTVLVSVAENAYEQRYEKKVLKFFGKGDITDV